MRVFVSSKDVHTEQAKWIDARFSLQDENRGIQAYNEAHIEGAVHWDLANDLSDASIEGGRHMLPSKKRLTDLFRTSGLDVEDTILIYDDGGSPFATRAWWILHYAGFKNVHVLLEGFEQLKALGFVTTQEVTRPTATTVEPTWRDELYVNRSDVAEVVAGDRQAVLVDARAAVRYRGEQEPIDKRAGHIPTARNFDWEQLKVAGQYNVQHAAELLKQVVQPEDDLIVYCGSGVTASPVVAALTELGYPNVRLYVGSFSDWISQDDAPIETV
ncbi:sulfurtransferase [Sporosarcina sp. GW1-11]|uniref:sulfurtransferase n=1 Tax=Sporosarcina sp. GW1-11 TaxID=2899126 RepID=UPI00294BAEAC|nr:sulfurtransferase [Sporosarcina sp. GW1-11]MDV6378591.1 sulfurtransferase [Sporosarcina sp. GW1-11]